MRTLEDSLHSRIASAASIASGNGPFSAARQRG
jgi:hypothetical protein